MIRFGSVIVLVFAFLISVAAQEKKQDTKKEDLKLSKEEQAVIDLTNAERKNADAKPLTPNPLLMAVARAHAANMAKQDKLEHVLDGKEPYERVKEAGYKYSATGENIAWNALSPREVVKGWMDSPPHKANILNTKYTEIGVAVATNEKGERYWVQVFGAPRKK